LKKSRKIITAVTVLLLLGISLIFLRSEKEKTEDSVVEAEESKDIQLIDLQRDEVLSIQYDNGGERIIIENNHSQWTVNNGQHSNISSQKLYSLLRALLNLKALETVNFTAENGEQWGLSENSRRIKIKTKNEAYTIIIGSLNPIQTGFYIEIEEADEIYLIDMFYKKSLTISVDDLRERTLPSFDASLLSSMEIRNKFPIKIVPFGGTDLFSAGLFSFMMVEPYNNTIPVNSERYNKFIETIQTPVEIVDFIDYGTPEDFGIDENAYNIRIEETQGNVYELIIGAEADNHMVYGKRGSDNQIFTLNKSDLPFLDIKPFDLIDRFPYLVPIDYIDSFTITNENETVSASIKRSGDDISFSINDRDAGEKLFKTFYQNVIYLIMEGEVTKSVDMGKPDFSITYKLTGSDLTGKTLYFYPYNDEFYAVGRDDIEPEFIIGRYQLNKMWNKVQDTLLNINER